VYPERLRYLDAYLARLVDSGEHPFAAVSVLRDGELVFSGAYGVSSPGGAPLTEDAIYPMASITKCVVATLIAILQEDGKVDLWDKLTRYYPEFTGGKKDEVELWQLMCHTSGMSDEVMTEYIDAFVKEHLGITLTGDWGAYYAALQKARGPLGLPDAEGEAAVEEAETLLKLRAPLSCDPHTSFVYCNMNYILLARLIEKLSGEDIESFSRRRLFEPLGMTDTHFILPKEKWPRVVKRDASFIAAQWLNSDFVLTSTSGAGGLKSTPRDMARLGQMYLDGGMLGGARIISPATVRLLTSDHNDGLPASFWFGRWLGANWGLGWNVRCRKNDDMGMLRSSKSFDHGGLGGARLLVDPESGLVVSLYLVDRDERISTNLARVINIIYSALD
jgi:CubicO group peptidase (beta-lactamase class C family)